MTQYYAPRDDDDGEGWTDEEARTTPVNPDKCVWCKIPRDDATTEYVDLSTHESICQTCLKDLREWKRYVEFQFWVSSGLEPTVERLLHDHGSVISSRLEQFYADDDTIERLSKQYSNAKCKDFNYDPPQDRD